ncbi:hypothetical protein XANCAGTX0491_009515 [Xanthoria calcicola]
MAKNYQRKSAKQLAVASWIGEVAARTPKPLVEWVFGGYLQSVDGRGHFKGTKGRIDAFADCATISKISKDSLSSETIASIQIWENIPLAAHSPDGRTARTTFIRHALIDRTLVIHQTDGLQDGPREAAEARTWIFGSLAKYESLTQTCYYRSFDNSRRAIQSRPAYPAP